MVMPYELMAPLGNGTPGVLRSNNREYVAALDYLRGFAAVTVVFYHGWITYAGYMLGGWSQTWPLFWNPLAIYVAEGHTAVGLFMVLSGYVLTTGVLHKEISYGKFIINRILRIYPLYILLLVFAVYTNPQGFSLAAFVETLLPFANLPGSIAAGVVTAMFWAVAVEFQFYLLFPVLISFLKKHGQSYLILIIVLALVLRVLAAFGPSDAQKIAYFTIFGRIDQFVLGILAASFPVGPTFRKPLTFPLLVIGGLSILIVYHRLGGYPLQAWWKNMIWPTIEGGAWAAIIFSAVHTPLRMPTVLQKPIVIVADMSFSIYLLHSQVFQIVGERKWYMAPFSSEFLNAFANALWCLIPILSLSYLTFVVVERPFMGLRTRYAHSPAS